MAVSVYDIENLIASGIDEHSLVKQLFKYTNEDDYIIKHRCYYVLMKLASHFSSEHLFKIKNLSNMLEEDILRLLDITTKLEIDSPLIFVSLLHSKNPYLIRGEVVALAKNGSIKSLDLLLAFAISTKGRIIRRELFSEIFGYMITREPTFKSYIDEKKLVNPSIRGYLRDMELIGPKYKRISVFPANDYWALKARAKGLDYVNFKKIVEGKLF